jgi:hypothetical protein
MKRIIEWFKDRDGVELLIIGGVVGILVLVVLQVTLESNERAEFMRECEQDRPKYECTAMWRSGKKPAAPIVIVQ